MLPTRTKTLALLAIGAAVLPATPALATTNAHPATVRFQFSGPLLETPVAGATSVRVDVRNGNHRALRRLIGTSGAAQTFAVNGHTEYLRWREGIPVVVTAEYLRQGDWVTVRTRAPRGSSLAVVESTPANIVADRAARLTPVHHAAGVVWSFRGTLSESGTTALRMDVTGGDARALRVMLGQPREQTFTVGTGTIFLLWQGRVPTVVSRADLHAGDRVVVQIRAPRGSTLGALEALAARHVEVHRAA